MNEKNWQAKTILIGTAVGALVGVAASLIIVKRAESEGTTPKLTAGDGVQVGLGLLGVLRLIAGIGPD